MPGNRNRPGGRSIICGESRRRVQPDPPHHTRGRPVVVVAVFGVREPRPRGRRKRIAAGRPRLGRDRPPRVPHRPERPARSDDLPGRRPRSRSARQQRRTSHAAAGRCSDGRRTHGRRTRAGHRVALCATLPAGSAGDRVREGIREPARHGRRRRRQTGHLPHYLEHDAVAGAGPRGRHRRRGEPRQRAGLPYVRRRAALRALRHRCDPGRHAEGSRTRRRRRGGRRYRDRQGRVAEPGQDGAVRRGVAGIPMSAIMMDGPQAPVPAANTDNDDTINLLEYWQVLRDRQWVVAGVAAAVFVLALVATLLATPIFRASSTLQIERDTMKIMDVEGLTPAESPMDRDFYQTQYELLRSRSLARRVVQDLRLTEHPRFAETMADIDAALEAGKGNDTTRKETRERALVEPVLEALTIEPVRNSRLVRVNFDSPDPDLAARVSNAWSDAFIAGNLERRFDASSYARKYLEERLSQLKAKLEDSETALVDFATQEQIVSVGEDKPSLSAQNLGELNAALAVAQAARIRAEAAWGQAQAGDGLGLPQVVASPLVQKLRESRSLLAAQYQEQLRTFKADYPDMQRLAGQISETDRQIATEVGHIRSAVRSEYDAARQQEALLESRMGGLKGDVLDLQGRSIRYNILRREAETNRQLYDGLLQRYKEIGVVG